MFDIAGDSVRGETEPSRTKQSPSNKSEIIRRIEIVSIQHQTEAPAIALIFPPHSFYHISQTDGRHTGRYSSTPAS